MSDKPNVKTIKVQSAPNAKQEICRKREQKERRSNIYSIICLCIMCVVTVGGGIALVIVGNENDIDDLIIIGSICLLAGVLFLTLIILAVTRPYRKKCSRVNHKNKEEDSDGLILDQGYINYEDTRIEDPDKLFKKTKPSNVQLYGKDKFIIHLPEHDEVKLPPKPLPPPPTVTYPDSLQNSKWPVSSVAMTEVTDTNYLNEPPKY